MIRYICEPEKNTECSKTLCQEFCKATAFEEFAKRDENGRAIVACIDDLFEPAEESEGTA